MPAAEGSAAGVDAPAGSGVCPVALEHPVRTPMLAVVRRSADVTWAARRPWVEVGGAMEMFLSFIVLDGGWVGIWSVPPGEVRGG